MRVVMEVNPIYHLSETYRGMRLSGPFSRHLLMLLLTSIVRLLICNWLNPLIKRHIVGE